MSYLIKLLISPLSCSSACIMYFALGTQITLPFDSITAFMSASRSSNGDTLHSRIEKQRNYVHMRRLLAICDEYAREYNISFNANKSKYMVIVPNSRRRLYDLVSECSFFIGNKAIERVDSFVHLGHVLSSTLNDNEDIERQRSVFMSQANNVLCYFNKLYY